jgi:hypothetical protein
VDGVDRLLTRAHGLFPAAAGDGGEAFSAGGGGGSVPGAPAGASGLGTGAAMAGGVYTRSQTMVAGLDAESGEAAAEADVIGAQGFSGSGVIRDQARAQAAAIAPLTNSAAGMRLMVSTMDAHVAAMQQQVGTTSAENQALSTRLRAAASGYQMAGFGKGGPPLDRSPTPPQPAPPAPAAPAPPGPGPGPNPFLNQWEQDMTAPPAPQTPASPIPAPPGPAPQPFLNQWQQQMVGPAPPPPQAPVVSMPSGGSPPPPPPLGQCVQQKVVPDVGKHMIADGFSDALAGGLAGAVGGAVVTPEVGGAGGLPGFVLGFVGGFAKGAFEAPIKETGKGLLDCLAEEAGQ